MLEMEELMITYGDRKQKQYMYIYIFMYITIQIQLNSIHLNNYLDI